MSSVMFSAVNAQTAAANAAAAVAAAEAHDAKITACTAIMRGYSNDTASRSEMRQYAECVQVVAPSADDMVPLGTSLMCAVLFIGMAVGAFRARRGYYDCDDILLGAIGGLVWTMMIMVIIGLLACALAPLVA